MRLSTFEPRRVLNGQRASFTWAPQSFVQVPGGLSQCEADKAPPAILKA